MNAAAAQRPGAELRAAREAAGMSEEQAADALRLAVTVVRAVESNAFQALPAPAYARGYVRAYARLLGLDADALLCGQDLGLGGAPAPRLLASDAKRTFRDLLHERLGWVFGGAALVVGVVASLVLWWAWLADAPADVAEPSPPAAAAASEPAPAATAQAPPIAPAPAATDANDAATPVTGEADAPSGADADAASPSAVMPLSAVGSRLAFTFTEDCWVEVFDRMDRPMHRDLNRAGGTLVLRGQAPLRIKLGNAPGVTLEYDGHAVALAPHTRNRVANLVLE